MRIGFAVIVVVVGALTAAATPLFALSCMPPDIATNYRVLDDAKDTYVIVRGRVSVETQPYELGRETNSGSVFEYKSHVGRFTGHIANRRGFTVPFSDDVEFKQACRLWPNINVCEDLGTHPGQEDEEEMIYFLRKTDVGYDFVTGDCPGGVHPATRANERQVNRCMRGAECKPAWE
mgnify:CR=1 FL=1